MKRYVILYRRPGEKGVKKALLKLHRYCPGAILPEYLPEFYPGSTDSTSG